MTQPALPPGVTSLTARATPNFSAPLLSAPSASDINTFGNFFSSAALARDPRSVIAEADTSALREWVRSLLGNSWSENLTIDDVMRLNPRILYKAVCLYLQGRYWGQLPNDWTGESDAAPDMRLAHEGGNAFGRDAWGNPTRDLHWMDKQTAPSPFEQRIFKWNLKMQPIAAPSNMSYLADDVNGAIYMPVIVPSMLLQSFDDARGSWRTLNLGGTDREFTLDSPGGVLRLKGWDFGDWYQSNATFMEIIKIAGIIIVAAAAAVTGGAALIGGAGLSAAFAAGAAGAQAAQQLIGPVEKFLSAVATNSNDFGQMFNAVTTLVQGSFGIDLKSLATYQPGIDQLGATFESAVGPYVNLLKSGVGGDTASDVFKTILEAGRTADGFVQQANKLFTQFSIDASRVVTGLPPDLMLKTLATMGTNDVIQLATKIKADYTARANAAIEGVKNQIPLFLNDWKEHGRQLVHQIGRDAAMTKASEVPWYGLTAFNLGTVIGGFEANISLAVAPDINSLTSPQKRALFFGDIATVCGGGDATCLLNAAEFMRQSDGFWQSVQQMADRYGLRPPAEQLANVSPAERLATVSSMLKR